MIERRKLITILTVVASIVSVGFGLWHFFIPGIWNWYAYIDKDAAELIIAVRAINVFFSLLLVLLGVANGLIITRKLQHKFSVAVILSVSAILWLTRVALQLIYPQGSQNPAIQYGMLVTFIVVCVCFIVSLVLLLRTKMQQV